MLNIDTGLSIVSVAAGQVMDWLELPRFINGVGIRNDSAALDLNYWVWVVADM